MHAVIGHVSLDPSRRDEAVKLLNEVTMPRTKAMAGFVSATWCRAPEGDRGTSVLVFETEEAARAAVEQVRQGPPPGGPATFVSADVFEVVAQA
jgi:antibiotic biosynthesis monooxygenase